MASGEGLRFDTGGRPSGFTCRCRSSVTTKTIAHRWRISSSPSRPGGRRARRRSARNAVCRTRNPSRSNTSCESGATSNRPRQPTEAGVETRPVPVDPTIRPRVYGLGLVIPKRADRSRGLRHEPRTHRLWPRRALAGPYRQGLNPSRIVCGPRGGSDHTAAANSACWPAHSRTCAQHLPPPTSPGRWVTPTADGVRSPSTG